MTPDMHVTHYELPPCSYSTLALIPDPHRAALRQGGKDEARLT